MKTLIKTICILPLGVAVALLSACSSGLAPLQLTRPLKVVVAPVKDSVMTVAALDMNGEVSAIGSGFFVDRNGALVTNHHVLEGAYGGAVLTATGGRYPITGVIARNPLVDLIKVRVQIPAELSVPVVLSDDEPQVADRVVVIGSPMGLAQTISEGIVSAVREHPTGGKIYQLTAPISQGSSGGPTLNLKGEVVGVVTFQAAKGQNLNFAISSKILQMLTQDPEESTLAELTLKRSGSDPSLAAALCRQGTRLSINGEYEAALDYFQQATEADPDDAEAWHGLGSCYVGLNQPDNAVDAYQKSIDAAPESATAHFMLAMFHKALEQYNQAAALLVKVIHIDADNIQARLELADTYGELDQADAQIELYRGILDIKPDDVRTLHRMGQTVGQMGRYDEALTFLLKASALEPGNAIIHFDIGVTYHHKQLPEKELRAYTQAIRANPRMAPAHHNIGLVFLERGNRKLALQQYEILKSLDAEKAENLFGAIYPDTIDAIGKVE